MKRGLFLLLIAAPLLAAVPGCGRSSPSILLITIDTLREDAVGAFGSTTAKTPNIDRLAAEGTRFTDARSACPLTLPSHLTILTGLFPAEHGIRDNDPARPLPARKDRGFATLAESLGGRGYATAAFVSSSVLAGRTGISAGFDRYDEPGEPEAGELTYAERRGDTTVAAAGKWLAGRKGPFFLFVHLFDPHAPYRPPLAFRSGAAPDTPAAYADEVAFADYCVGKLLASLRDAGREADTLVLLTADHGEGLGEHGEPTHGYYLYDSTLRVPLVVRWPGHVDEGAERRDPVSLVDVTPTLLKAAGIPEKGRGTLLEPGRADPVFAETLYGYREMGWAQLLAVVSGHQKLIRGHRDELYDLARDPKEENPSPTAPPGLSRLLATYREREAPPPAAGEDLTPIEGLPYTHGVGRERSRTLLSEEKNRALPRPDPGLALELDALKSRVGRDAPEAVERDLLALAARDPRNPSIPFWLGRNAAAKRPPDHSAAAKWFEVAFGRGLADAKVLDLWLKHLLLAGRVKDAGDAIREHLAEVTPDAGTWVMVGTVNMLDGKLDRARLCADRAERLAHAEADRKLVSQFRHNLSQKEDK